MWAELRSLISHVRSSTARRRLLATILSHCNLLYPTASLPSHASSFSHNIMMEKRRQKRRCVANGQQRNGCAKKTCRRESSRRRWLDLPPEIRNKIYHEYFWTTGGYILDFPAQKLVLANSEAIDLALLFTCKEAAGLPLHVNTVLFSTVGTVASDARSRRSRLVFEEMIQRERTIFELLIEGTDDDDDDDDGRPSRIPTIKLTPEMYAMLRAEFPQMTKMLHQLEHRVQTNASLSWLEHCPKMYGIDLIKRAFNLLVAHYGRERVEEATRDMRPWRAQWQGVESHREFFEWSALPHDPWHIPSDQKLSRMEEIFHDKNRRPLSCHEANSSDRDRPQQHQSNTLTRFGRVMRRMDTSDDGFSAAAVAAQFIKSLPSRVRLRFRNVVLNEDGRSSPFPECHGRALIPLCRANPHLRIDRRVEVFANFGALSDDNTSLLRLLVLSEPYPHPQSRAVSRWLTEALDLLVQGMPPYAFTLTRRFCRSFEMHRYIRAVPAKKTSSQTRSGRGIWSGSSIWHVGSHQFFLAREEHARISR